MALIVRERDELATAIAKLRGSIGHLNREGRERLSAVFHQVDRHFQTLFSPHVRGRPRPPGAAGLRRPASRRARDLRAAAWQEAGLPRLAVRRRAGPDGAQPHLRGVPLQPGAALCAGRGRRAAGRRQRGALLRPAVRHGATDRDPVPGRHPPSADDGADGPAVRRDDAGARRCRGCFRSTCRGPLRWWRPSPPNNGAGCLDTAAPRR